MNPWSQTAGEVVALIQYFAKKGNLNLIGCEVKAPTCFRAITRSGSSGSTSGGIRRSSPIGLTYMAFLQRKGEVGWGPAQYPRSPELRSPSKTLLLRLT